MKNLINKDATQNRSKERGAPQNTSPESDEANIKISDHGTWLRLDVNKTFLNNNSNFDISRVLSIALSPFFTNENKQPNLSTAAPTEHHSGAFPRIGFFVENNTHYTGGRYSTYMYALLLSQFTDVTWVTNDRPIFEKDFKDYNHDKFRIAVDRNFLIQTQECEFDIVVGTPVVGGSYASEYAKKFHIPLYAILFESPNWISMYRESEDSDETFWKGYKRILKSAERVIVPSMESAKYFREWDPDFGDKDVQVVYPPLNELAIRRVQNEHSTLRRQERREKRRQEKGWKKEIVYSTRMAPFKNPLAILKRIGKDIGVHIIGKVWSDARPILEKMPNVVLHGTISDQEKMEIIAGCDAMIYPTTFEGAGMPPAEALRFKVPVITTDLPVLKEIYQGHVYYAKKDSPEQFVNVLRSILNDPPNMLSQHAPEALHMSVVSEKLRTTFNIPSITAGIIHYNCYEYLEYAIKSIYPVVSKIIVVNGKVDKYPGGDGNWPLLDEIDYLNKIEIVDGDWSDKIEMQNEIASRVDTDYYVKIDADEIWDPNELMAVIGYMEENKEVKIVHMPFLHFWTNFRTVARDAGGKWGTKHPRVWRWSKGMWHFKSFNFFTNNNKERLPVKTPHFKHTNWQGKPIFHFGWARPLEAAQAKINYYTHRGIEEHVKDHYTPWKELTDPTMCTQNVRSWAEKWEGELPKAMKDHPWFKTLDIRKEEIVY